MKKNIFFILFAGIIVLETTINAESPFKVMNDSFKNLNTEITKNKTKFFTNYKFSKEDIKRGFVSTIVDESVPSRSRPSDERPFVIREMNAFASQGQYVMRTFAVIFSASADSLVLELKNLKSVSGKIISSENIRVFRILRRHQNKNYSGDFLIKPELKKVPAESVIFYAVLIYAPLNTAPGLYQSTIKMSSGQSSFKLPVKFRVLNEKLPETKNSFGLYIPGHTHNKAPSQYRNFAPDFFTTENLDEFLSFWKSRKLNSPSLFHVYPEWKKINGKREPEFAMLRTFISAMKKCGLNGYLCIDTRFYSWFSDAKSRNNDKEAKKFYADIITKLIATAEKEKWSGIKLCAEEEIANGGKKIETYRKYWPVLRKVAKGMDFIIDNDIGRARKNAVDRGNRDNFKVIQYKSWTSEALKKARENNAEVWTYNYGGFNRGNFGFLQQRLGSKANHQWADMWLNRERKRKWIFCLPTGDGVVSSMQYERIHEGINDFAYCELLREKINQLQAINPQQAAQAQKNLKDIVKEIPVEGPAFRNWMKYTSDNKLDIKRWQLALAVNEVDKALGNASLRLSNNSEGTIKTYSVPITKEIISNSKILYLPIANEPLNLDGKMNEQFWRGKNNTGALRLTVSEETRLQAYSSSDAEFKKLCVVSRSAARASYNEKGFLLTLFCNNATPGKAKADSEDNDGNMWRDDCMEFFFKPEGARGYFQLIVNAKGKKTLLKSGKAISTEGIKTATFSPIHKGGGYSQEIFIPWKRLGLDKMPPAGSLWKFNVGREFHSFRQYTSWGRVYRSFHEMDKWGQIVFTGKKGRSLFEGISMNSGLPGMNRLSGKIKIPANMMNKDLRLVLSAENNKIISTEKITGRQKNFSFQFNFRIPHLKKDEKWQLQLISAENNVIETLNVAAYAAPKSINITSCEPVVIAGDILEMTLVVGISPSELRKHKLDGIITNLKTGSVTVFPKLFLQNSGNCKLWLKTGGLEAGKYQLKLWVDGYGSSSNCSYSNFKVLPNPCN